MGPNKHTMGSNAIESKENWQKVEPWRKREAYISLGVFLSGTKSRNKWENSLWDQYVQRQLLGETFMVRHANLWCAEHFEGQLEDPAEWSRAKTKKRAGKRKRSTRQPTTLPPASRARTADPISPVPMRYDSQLGRLVPF